MSYSQFIKGVGGIKLNSALFCASQLLLSSGGFCFLGKSSACNLIGSLTLWVCYKMDRGCTNLLLSIRLIQYWFRLF